jgi:NusA-like KH domain protein
VLVFEDSQGMEQFVRNLFGSVPVKNINVHEKSDSKIAYVTVDEKDRGTAIGRNGDRIKVGRALLQRRFGCDLRLVSK